MTRIHVRVQPRSRRTTLGGWRPDGALQVAVVEAPEDGSANRAVAVLLAEALGVRRHRVSVVRGLASRAKVVEVEGVSEIEIRNRIGAALAGQE